MNRRRSRLAAAFAIGALMAFGWGVATPSAWAGAGTLIVVPQQGDLGAPMDIITSGTCTRGLTFVVEVRGKGLDPATSGNLVGSTPLPVADQATYPGHYFVPLSYSWIQYFTNNGLGVPKGNYAIVFACRNRLDSEDLQTFEGTVAISPEGYRATGVAATPAEEFAGPAQIVPGDSGDSGQTGQPAADVEPAPASTDAPSSAALAAGDPAPSGDSFPWRPVLLAGGVALLLAAGFALLRQRKGS